MSPPLSDRLRQVREYLSLTQAEMGAKIGKSARAWQAYERGINIPGGEVYDELLKLGININWLLSGKGVPDNAAPAGGNPDLPCLSTAIRVVEQALADSGRRMLPDKKAELISIVYEFISLNEKIEPDKVMKLIRSAA
jgi:transcriptional regulator with XRE-family HTH domain